MGWGPSFYDPQASAGSYVSNVIGPLLCRLPVILLVAALVTLFAVLATDESSLSPMSLADVSVVLAKGIHGLDFSLAEGEREFPEAGHTLSDTQPIISATSVPTTPVK